MKTPYAVTVCSVEGINNLNPQQLIDQNTLILGEKIDPEDMTLEERASIIQRIIKIYESDIALTNSLNNNKKDYERKQANRVIQTLKEGNYISFIKKITKFLDKEFGKNFVTLHQRLWHIVNYQFKIQVCPLCNEKMKWREFKKEYVCKNKCEKPKEKIMNEEIKNEEITTDSVINVLVKKFAAISNYRIVKDYFTKEQLDFINEVTSFLPKDASLLRRIYHIITGDYSIPVCPACGKQTRWHEISRNYSTYCSHECVGIAISVEGRENLKRFEKLNRIIANKFGIEKFVGKPSVTKNNNNNKKEKDMRKNKEDGLLPQEAYEEIEKLKKATENVKSVSVSSASSDISVMGNKIYFLDKCGDSHCLFSGIVIGARLDIETFNKTGGKITNYEVYCSSPSNFKGIQVEVKNGIFANSKQELLKILPNILEIDKKEFIKKQENDLVEFKKKQENDFQNFCVEQENLYRKYKEIINISNNEE